MKRSDVFFLSVQNVILAHARGIALTPGEPREVRDAERLKSATLSVEQGYYATLSELGGAYLYQISQSQPFLNGNKRAAVIATAGFLAANGYPIHMDTRTWCRLLDDVAERKTARGEVGKQLIIAMGGKDELVTEDD